VASVFHLGRSGHEYFYAMEFVEGETLERMIGRSGRLEVKLALEIASQVAAGLTAVQKQNLVHRDIKPSNIMVCMEEGEALTAKIIDLGLAKGVAESQLEAAISVPGGFVGTPAFASPEQLAGIGVDIRSDLYSLGVTLWDMLAGEVPFRGTAAELMHQHLHAALPVTRLRHVPESVVAILEILLNKDPARRFQTPNELLNAIQAFTRSLEAKRKIKDQELQARPGGSLSRRKKELSQIRVPKRSVAVLPFDTLSPDSGKRSKYFADGVQDEILSKLAKVSRLRVISRT
jgi:serine/threonine protein kinase